MAIAPAPGVALGHYRLVERIGRGAMGEVWLAQDSQLPRKVAIKVLAPHLGDDHEAVERLLREARAVASVDHPSVVAVYEAGIAGERPYVVMQHLDGETLDQRLERGPLPVAEAVAIADRLADALAEVHALGIVHRDLKPANVMLTARGPRMLDFGLASIRGAMGLTATGALLGTPLTMSPEQIRGQLPDNRSDLWSLGVMLWWMVAGRPPFTGESFEAVANAILNAAPPALSAVRSGVATDLDYVAAKLLRREPSHRYARAEDLLADLRNLGGAGAGAATDEAAAQSPRLAVMYFEVMSAEPDDAFLAAGLTEDLIVDLSRVEGVRVATRAEVGAFRERELPPRTLGRELDADYVLLGSVRRAGQRARISAQLVRAADGHVLWAERFDRTLDDLFDVQAEVSRRIVDALQLTLTPVERELMDRAPTRSAEAYRDYLRAIELMDRNRADNVQAEVLLRRAIGLDPGFALAHAALGRCFASRALRWWASYDVAGPSLEFARRALELDPGLVDAELVIAMVYRLQGDAAALVPALERLRERIPDDPQALEWMAWSYLTLVRPADAIPLLERILVFDRTNYVAASYLSSAYDMMGRSEDAKREHERTSDLVVEWVRRHPEDALAREFLAIHLVRAGRVQEALHHAETGVALDPDSGRVRYNAACAFARAGMKERAMAELKEGVRRVPEYVRDWPSRDPDLALLHDDPEFRRMFTPLKPDAA